MWIRIVFALFMSSLVAQAQPCRDIRSVDFRNGVIRTSAADENELKGQFNSSFGSEIFTFKGGLSEEFSDDAQLLYKLRHPDPNPNAWMNVGGGCERPGRSSDRNIAISDFYDLTEPGTYTIQISRRLERLSPDWVKSNIITIMVDEGGCREVPN